MPAADQYLETQVLTAPPEQLHMLVVDGALRFARLGVQALKPTTNCRTNLSAAAASSSMN